MIGMTRLAPVLGKSLPWIVSVGVHGAVLGGVLWVGQTADTDPTPMVQVEVIVLAEPSATPGGKAIGDKQAAATPAAPTPSAEKTPSPPDVSDAVVAAIDESERSATEGLPPAPSKPAVSPDAKPEIEPEAKTAPPVEPVAAEKTVSLPARTPPPAPRARPRAMAMTVAPSVTAPVARRPSPPRARPARERPAQERHVPVAARSAPPEKPRSVTFLDTGDKVPPTTPTGATAGEATPQTAALPAASAPRLGTGAGNAAPRYPMYARENGWQGRVVLRVAVDAAGRAQDVAIKTSSGHRVLDRAARDAVEDWRFHPATRFGRPVAGVVEVPISFRLRE